ncbi:helix-turn-helix domain-containing protein [Halosolutus amylolyticus]|uniref:Helix-turn-helix domain-containing protein n=1 Tax=Halosolutus amylolyticus TaxID=2932267 RepID=A0ABD5PPS9_9EURY|nr:helix-turn-helix domain-containing protein [Halosolutus amylolyticus]
MLTAKLSVRYEGDWTAELDRYDVTGQFLASTYRDRRYFGLFALEAAENECEAVIDVIREHETTDTIDVIERYQVEGADRVTATVIIKGQYFEFTPLQVLLHEGFIPLANFGEVRDGRETFDLLLSKREDLAEAVDLLERFGPVTIEYVSRDFQRRITPSVTEWAELFETVTPRRRRVLNEALEAGYFDVPRGCTLEEIADDLGIAKTTASQHLRKAEKDLMQFFIKYVNLSA